MDDSEEKTSRGDEMIIAVTGTIGAGETAFRDILVKKGFKQVSLSDILREKLKGMEKEVTRDNLRWLGDKLREEEGGAALAKLAWKKISAGGNWVVDSVMSVEEMNFLREKGAYAVGITAPEMARYERSVKRKETEGQDSFKSFEDFLQTDAHDRTIGVDDIMENVDFVINNDGTLEDLEAIADMIVETISSRG